MPAASSVAGRPRRHWPSAPRWAHPARAGRADLLRGLQPPCGASACPSAAGRRSARRPCPRPPGHPSPAGLQAGLSEQRAADLGADRVVLGHQHPAPVAGPQDLQARRGRVGRSTRAAAEAPEATGRRSVNQTRVPCAGALQADVAAHHPHQLARDGQAQAGAAVAPAGRPIGLFEGRNNRGEAPG
jgi:hypothetical protein